ncbi:hypothetical protein Z052_01200 [Halorubrum sp. C191]|uniref:protein phosphatase 2C domain-containing protein n=1 Tax=Halorubrum sp. C191 TaxID=1383842 RepID=UPI000C085959|nr:protein phosphatase 2C domain-containing protein [Halorubrum sp. C191]PHQ43981.1 hypothetical protein Z052_01200 [Halorubrum sp. C191]
MYDESSEMGRLVGCAVKGPKHEKNDKPCQDAWDGSRLSDERFVVAVGDGLGSASLSHKGSKLATQVAVERLEAYVSGVERIEREASREALQEAVTGARNAVFQRADDINEPATELNTTLLVVAAGPSGVASAVVGDGGIVGRIGGENELLVPREMKVVDTEYSNVTVPLLHDEWEESYRFGYEPDCDEVAIFSDGIDEFTWDGLESVKDDFFDQIFDLVRSSTDLEKTTEQIYEYLDNEHHRKYSGDDKTLAVGSLPRSSETGAAESDRNGEAEGETADDIEEAPTENNTESTPDNDAEEASTDDETEPVSAGDDGHASRSAEDFGGKTVTTESGQVTLGKTVVKDEEGCLYRIKGGETDIDAVKILPPAHREQVGVKIRSMASNTLETNEPTLAWPEEVIETGAGGNAVLGYRTSFPGNDRRNALEHARADRREDDSTDSLLGGILAAVGFDDGREEREPYESALGLATAVNHLHQQGHAVGDLHHEHVFIDGNRVFLTGCDAYHVDLGGETYDGTLPSPRYAPPEDIDTDLTSVQRADRFSLSIHIFQFLMEGTHPYQARGSAAIDGGFETLIRENPFPYRESHSEVMEPPSGAPKYVNLPSELRLQFERCFVEGKTHPRLRPTAREWVETLEAVIDDPR